MSGSANFELDLREFVTLNIKCIHFFGYFSPEFAENSKKRILFRIYATVFVGFAFVLSLLSQIANMIDAFGDMEKMTEASFLLFTNIVQCLKLYCFMKYGARVWRLVHSLNRKIFKPRNATQYDVLKRDIGRSKIITKLFLLACTITYASWCVSPFLDKKGENGVRLPLSGWYPFSTKETPAFELAYAYQIFTTWVGGLGDISMDTFMSGAIMVISAELSVLNNALETLKQRFVDDPQKIREEEKLVNKELVRCVIHYKNIIGFANEVTYLFTDCITAQFLVGVIIVCMSMFQMSLVPVMSFRFFAMMLYQICVLMEMFLWCYYGNEVILKSDLLTQSAYMCEWVDNSKEFKQNLLYFMTRTQFNLQLYASGYFALSLQTFKAIIKSSWSYFAVLNQVHDQKMA
ncbi:hypothetical protein Zmor_015676 [Zophobas morio]|uniref:Odorant receptor n=2 Tax=Zophobas morio TaxID=2755281 RepID=A0AA38IH31_9CUCU|nr:hypothetical protein Zmor_015676 [Zophobas morio]